MIAKFTLTKPEGDTVFRQSNNWGMLTPSPFTKALWGLQGPLFFFFSDDKFEGRVYV